MSWRCGFGRFFLNLSASGALQGALGIAEAAALTVTEETRRVGPTRCHGLSGNIEFLLDIFQVTRDEAFLHGARDLARILETFRAKRTDGLLGLQRSLPRPPPDYIVGYAGVAVCLLRLAAPEGRPHQLSMQGFRWQGSHLEASADAP